MKSKKLNYALIGLMAVVWGLIITKVIGAARGGDDTPIANPRPIAKMVYTDDEAPDTIQLHLNYPDPFRQQTTVDTTKKMLPKILPIKMVKAILPLTNWSAVNYAGYIRNPGSKKIIALLSVNGRNLMLAEGESQDHIKLLKNLRDSVLVNYNGALKYINLHSGQ